ncbi:3-hydroxybutyryl-CoA dehydrogenase [Deltaproteobacteria bacterium TL4]
MEIKEMGIIGAGQMGIGIAHVSAMAGIKVILNDMNEDLLKKGLQTIEANFERQLLKNKINAPQKEAALAKISVSTSMSAFAASDFVIEVATENLEIKGKIFQQLCQYTKPEALIASNTSSISITKLASLTKNPERFIGMHFMNPVPVMQLVEIIRGITTSNETFETTRSLAIKLGKTPCEVQDFPGFVVNRVLIPMINEAIYILQEKVGGMEEIDTCMKLGANMPMGPIELADLIGLDICLAIMRVLHQEMGDSKYRPAPLLVKYVEAQWLGRKTGRGFYDYSGKKPVPTR